MAAAPHPATPPHRTIYSGEGWAQGGGEEQREGGGRVGAVAAVAAARIAVVAARIDIVDEAESERESVNDRDEREREEEATSFDLGKGGGWSGSKCLDQWESFILKSWIDDVACVSLTAFQCILIQANEFKWKSCKLQIFKSRRALQLWYRTYLHLKSFGNFNIYNFKLDNL